MTSKMASHRRRRSEIEDNEDSDAARTSRASTPSTPDSAKRARTNGYGQDSPSVSSEPDEFRIRSTDGLRDTTNGASYGHSASGENSNEEGEFQPGAIVRVKLTNFVTYESAEFLPGPNLNMVIGPNGTGKSSLVCAICLGLGWGPQHLGRATQIGEFIKHGLDEAYIEIELQRRSNERHNHIVRVRIIREGNNREWWLDGKRTSLKAVQALTKSLSIQIDNLCQFLPQDKVSEFAALSPVELLQQTQRAAAPEHMLEWHEELKKLRKDQKLLEEQSARDKEHLETQETRQENLRAEVQRLEERNQIQDKVEVLKKTVPFVEYKTAREQHMACRRKKDEAQVRLSELKALVDPTLESVNHKREYRDKISFVVSERKKIVQAAERAADMVLLEIEKLDGSIHDIEQKADAERGDAESRRKDILKIQRKIKDVESRMQEEPIEFNSVEWNEKIVSTFIVVFKHADGFFRVQSSVRHVDLTPS